MSSKRRPGRSDGNKRHSFTPKEARHIANKEIAAESGDKYEPEPVTTKKVEERIEEARRRRI